MFYVLVRIIKIFFLKYKKPSQVETDKMIMKIPASARLLFVCFEIPQNLNNNDMSCCETCRVDKL